MASSTVKRIAIGVVSVPAVIVIGVLIVMLATARGGDETLYPARSGVPGVTIYIHYSDIHADIIVPSDALARHPGPTAQAALKLKPDPWIGIGWGDAGYYINTGPFWHRIPEFSYALFAPGNGSVLHLSGLTSPAEDKNHPNRRKLVLSNEGFAAMIRRADRGFRLKDGAPVVAAPGHARNALFFAGTETFSFRHLCNHWAGDLLTAAGVPTMPVLDTVSAGLGLDLDHRAKAQSAP